MGPQHFSSHFQMHNIMISFSDHSNASSSCPVSCNTSVFYKCEILAIAVFKLLFYYLTYNFMFDVNEIGIFRQLVGN